MAGFCTAIQARFDRSIDRPSCVSYVPLHGVVVWSVDRSPRRTSDRPLPKHRQRQLSPKCRGGGSTQASESSRRRGPALCASSGCSVHTPLLIESRRSCDVAAAEIDQLQPADSPTIDRSPSLHSFMHTPRHTTGYFPKMANSPPAAAAPAVPAALAPTNNDEEGEEEEIDLQQQPPTIAVLRPGLPLQTPYGWGTLRRRRRPRPQGDGMLEARLEWGARCYLRAEDVLDR